MILILLRFIKGYLDVLFSGVYSERVLSDLARENISVWKLKYSGGNISGRMYAKDFKKIRKIRKKAGVRIKIIKRHGLPFFAKRYTYRSGFLIGAVIFFALLKFLSTFIWVINVDGNTTVKASDITKTLNEIGIREKMKISDIEPKSSAQELLIKREDLAWASLNIEGCVLNVNVSEIEKKPDVDDNTPSNLVADKDGIIKKVDAVSGDVKVKVGENVHKGDVLVSGIIESMSGTTFVRSNAKIVAQVEMQYIKKEPISQRIKQKNGKSSNKKVLEILGVEVPLFLSKKEKPAYICRELKQAMIFGKKIPITVYTKRYEYYKKIPVITSEEVLKENLASRLKTFIDKNEIEGYIPIGTEFYIDDTSVTISHRYLCDVDIAEEKKILLG